VNAGDGQQALVLTSSQTGYANRIQVVESFDTGESSLQLTTANCDADNQVLGDLSQLDAAAKIEGIPVTSPTNELADTIDGVTVTLNKADPGTQSTLTVGLDTATIASSVAGFVKSYNALISTLSSVSGYAGDGKTQPALFADSTTRSIGERLRAELGSRVSGLDGDISSLADIGITTSLDGSLTIDSAKLNDALSADPTAVGALFSSDGGYATQLGDIVSSYLAPGGILDSRTQGLQASLKDISNQQDALNRHLTELQDRYTEQFNALDSLISQMNSTSTFLTQQLDNLPGAYSGSSK